jgi:hypothetical protein
LATVVPVKADVLCRKTLAQTYFFLMNSTQVLLFGLLLLAVAPTAFAEAVFWDSGSFAPSIVVAIVMSIDRRSVKSGCFKIKVKDEEVGDAHRVHSIVGIFDNF